MKYGNVSMGQVEAMINKLGGEQQFRRLLDGKIHVVGPIEVWKRIKVGTGLKSFDEFVGALKANEINDPNYPRPNSFHDDIEKLRFSKFVVSDQSKEVPLALVTNHELGLRAPRMFSEKGIPVGLTIDRAKRLGLNLCTREMAFQLRLQWVEHYKPKVDWIRILTPSATDQHAVDSFSIGSLGDRARRGHKLTFEEDIQLHRVFEEDQGFVFVIDED